MKILRDLFLLLVASACSAQSRWVTTWAAAPETPGEPVRVVEDQTIREIMHISVGGDAVRVRVSNQYGDKPLDVAAAHFALRSQGAAIVPGSDHALSFAGRPSVRVPQGAVWISDPVAVRVGDASDVAVSLYVKAATYPITRHTGALQTNYMGRGDLVADVAFGESPDELKSYPFVTGIEVSNASARGTVVALGDSITDGYSSHENTNHRWPNLLADKLIAAKKPYGVANLGISSNRLLHDGPPNALYSPGANALARFDSDVLGQAGVTHVVVFEGINDLGHPGSGQPLDQTVSAEDIEAAYLQFAERAHAHRIQIYVCTILPFEGTLYPGYYTPEKDAKRQQVNEWLRANKQRFDTVVDLDKALRDPQHPSRLLPAFDSGDHLHPSNEGMQAIADTMPLDLF